MKALLQYLSDEPVMAAAIAVVAAGYTVVQSFGFSFTDAQEIAISGLGFAVIAFAVVIRSRVTPDTKKKSTTRKR